VIKSDLVNVASGRGYNPIVGTIYKKQAQWLNWFRGDVNNFHTYTQKVNGKAKTFYRPTLNMPKKVCEDWVSVLWNERCEIKLKSDSARDAWNRVAIDNNFDVMFGNTYELAMGIGMGYMVEYLSNGKTMIDFIPYDNALPLQWHNRQVTALMTWTHKKTSDGLNVYLVATHKMIGVDYVIEYETFVSKSDGELGDKDNKYLALFFGEGVTEFKAIHMNSGKPFFQVLKPNTYNHHDIHSPYGVSVYATMLDYFMLADTLFEAYLNEYNGNKTRIMLDSSFFKTKMQVDDNGDVSYINFLDESDTTIMSIPFDSESMEGRKPIEIFKGELSFDQIELAINKVLQLIGFRAGFGTNYYSFKDGEVYQNNLNVISSQSDLYKTKKKHELVLKKAIEDMVYSVLYLEKDQGRYNGNIEEENIEVVFDDSIAVDDESVRKRYKELGDSGYIPKYKVVAKLLELDDEEAKILVSEAEANEQERNKMYLDDYLDE